MGYGRCARASAGLRGRLRAVAAGACAAMMMSLVGVDDSRAAAPPPPAYEVSPEIRNGELQALEVTLRLHAGADGHVLLELPQADVGVTDLWRHVRDFQAEGATAVTAPKPSERLIQARPGAPITVSYRVVSAYPSEPRVGEMETYNPLISPTRFWVYGEALFAYPKGARQATFRWTGAPAGFGFASSLERANGKPLPIDDLIQSVSVGGPAAKLYRSELAGAPVRLATVGQFGFGDQALLDATTAVIAEQRAFWGQKEGPFLVVAAPSTPEPGRQSIRGEGRNGAFAIQAGADIAFDVVRGILAHEYFHTWNPARLGGIREGDAEPLDYWFSEGFTDFYARKLSLRSGVYDLRDFVGDWNQMLAQYAASPFRAAPDARIAPIFWTDQVAQKLPYQRGSILAATWDRELRARSGGRVGLDDVMRAMRDRAAKPGSKTTKAPQLFEETIRGFGLEVRPDIERVPLGGAAVLLPEDAFGGCIKVTTREAPRFETGYSLETRDGARVLAKVDPAGPAYAAGLREGMIIIRRLSGMPGNSTQAWTVQVGDGGREHQVTYLPAGGGTQTLQQLEIPKDLSPEARDACVAIVAKAR